jgi:hypothetical protein
VAVTSEEDTEKTECMCVPHGQNSGQNEGMKVADMFMKMWQGSTSWIWQ